MTILKILSDILLSPAYPLYCPVCRKDWDVGTGYICPDCWNVLPRADSWEQFGLTNTGDPIPAYYRYDEVMRNLILQMKFYGRKDIAERLGEIVGEVLAQRCQGKFDAIVPVPLHPVRLRERGYNQVELIAHKIAESLNCACSTDLIIRARHTSPQSALSDRERLKNVTNAFSPTLDRRDNLPLSVLLIDDVMHTGSTLNACAEVLNRLGIRKVVKVALVR